MKPAVSVVLLGMTALGLSGCGNAMQSYLERDTPTQTAAVRQDLTMPPDLRLPRARHRLRPLRIPALAPDRARRPSTASTTAPAAPAAPASAAHRRLYRRPAFQQSKPDGTQEDRHRTAAGTAGHLSWRKKQQKNPNYGTVFNIGNIFTDE